FCVISMVVVGELLENYILASSPALIGSPLGKSVLLALNLLAMFMFTYLVVLLSRELRSWRTIEGVSVGLLSLWIVPHFLKGIFSVWVAGWWAAEVFILIGLLIGPALIGLLYLQEMFRAEESKQKATLYSDVLVHDISNLHQAMLVALGLLDIEDLPEETREMALEDARSCLRRAHQLVKNVRGLGAADRMEDIDFEEIDLVDSITQAMGQLLMEMPAVWVDFSVNKDEGECTVKANGLLTDLFYNLFRNSVLYSPDEKKIIVEIDELMEDGQGWWSTRVIDFGSGIEPSRRADLFTRFMKGAEGSGLGLSVVYALAKTYSGTVSVSNRIPGDYSQGTVFTVILPKA
ncbi:MAG: sensor histidine kinase, partial [Candidatus Hodarchaeota archaeon]